MDTFIIKKLSCTPKVFSPNVNSSDSNIDGDNMQTQEASSHSPPQKKPAIDRRYDAKYLAFGFICINMGGQPKPQCVICSQVLANAAMKPAKLRRYL